MQIDEAQPETWMTPIQNFIRTGTLPSNKAEARRLCYKADIYVEYDVTLYKRGFDQPLLKCIDGEECTYIMREIHEGICENHAGGGSLAIKILRRVYYWPTMRDDALQFA